MLDTIRSFLNNESGATAIEYGLIAALVAVAAIVGITAVGTGPDSTLTDVSTNL